MIETSISPTDSYEVKARRERLAKLAGVQRMFKALRLTGPPLSPEVFESLQTAQTAVMDLETAIADEGIAEMTGIDPLIEMGRYRDRIEFACRLVDRLNDGSTEIYDARHALWLAARRIDHEIDALASMPEDQR